MSRRHDILVEIEKRVKAALPAAEVLTGRLPKLGPDDAAVAVAILPGLDDPDEEAPRVRRIWEIVVAILRRADTADAAWLAFENEAFAPVMTAIEDETTSTNPALSQLGAPGSTLGGLCQALVRGTVEPVERVEGTRAEGVEITYQLAYPVSPGKT